jgi:blue light- and temperature-responsive anti-repressor
MRDYGQDLFRLTYVSRATLTGQTQFEDLTRAVVTSSQRNNSAVDVSGLLLAYRGCFLQALEGPRRNVSQIFSVIGRDLRHVQIEVLEGGAAQQRLFGRWSMCAHTITPEARPAIEALDFRGEFDPFELESGAALKLLMTLSHLPAVAQLARTA